MDMFEEAMSASTEIKIRKNVNAIISVSEGIYGNYLTEIYDFFSLIGYKDYVLAKSTAYINPFWRCFEGYGELFEEDVINNTVLTYQLDLILLSGGGIDIQLKKLTGREYNLRMGNNFKIERAHKGGEHRCIYTLFGIKSPCRYIYFFNSKERFMDVSKNEQVLHSPGQFALPINSARASSLKEDYFLQCADIAFNWKEEAIVKDRMNKSGKWPKFSMVEIPGYLRVN